MVLLDPVRQTFLLGQVNLFLALMVVADMTLDLPLPRGILVGLAAAIKVTPIIFIPYLLLTRQGRAGLRATATFCAAALLAAAFNFSTSWAYWTHYIHDPQRAGMLSWIGNQGVLGAPLERMIGHTVSTPVTFAIVLTVAAVGVAVAAAAYRRSSPLLGILVVAATESLASLGVVVAPLHLGRPAHRRVGARSDRPRYGERGSRSAWPCSSGPPRLVGAAARSGDHLRRPGLADPALGLLRAAVHRFGGRRRCPGVPCTAATACVSPPRDGCPHWDQFLVPDHAGSPASMIIRAARSTRLAGPLWNGRPATR